MQNITMWLWVIVIGAVLIAGGVYILMQDTTVPGMETDTSAAQTETVSPEETQAPSEGGTDSPGTPSGITMAIVASHNTAASCWTVIDGGVYDVTTWIAQHPGGARAITQLCGTDGTALFHGQHGDNQRQADVLVGMKIGVLAQ